MSRYRAYPEYKDSGVEWLGEVPGHWKLCSLKYMASIQYGIGEPPEYREIGTPLIRATNVSVGNISLYGVVRVDPNDIQKHRILWLDEGDIIVVRSGAYTGDSGIVRECHRPCIAGFDMVLRAKDCNPEFLQFALLSIYLKQGQIDLERERAAQPHLNADELGSCFLVAPPFKEQTQIATFLNQETAKIDRLIAKQEALIELLKEKRQAVISHAVTKGLDPDAPMKDSGVEWLGEIPAHWESGKLKRRWKVLDCKHVTADFFDEGYPLASITEVQSHYVDLSRAKKTNKKCYDHLIDGGRKPKSGDIIYSRNATVGEAAIVSCDDKFAMGQDVCLLRSSECDPEFFYYTLHSRATKEQLELLMVGATFKRINVENIKSFYVPFPPRSEQKKISKYLKSMTKKFDAIVERCEKQCLLLQERRTALISAAVTGKIDVRDWKPMEPPCQTP